MKNNTPSPICSFCKNTVNIKTDIVVCPDCGVPYHRNCYQENGKCLFEKDHDRLKKEIKDNLLVEDTDFLNQSKNFVKTDENIKSSYSDTKGTREDLASDLTRYIGHKSDYYIPIFDIMENKETKTVWNWSSFLFGPFYFFYRKMYLLSFPFFILYIAFGATSLFHYTEIMKITFLETLKSLSTGQIDLSKIIIPDSLLHLSQFLRILRLFVFITMLISGAIGNRLYKDHALNIIDNAKKLGLSQVEYFKILRKKGGVNKVPTIILVSVLIAISTIYLVISISGIYNSFL